MKVFSLAASLALVSGLSACASLDCKQHQAELDAQNETLNRIERQNAVILGQLQAHENAIKALEPKASALLRQQTILQCLILSERAHTKCMSIHHTLTDNAKYLDQVQRCLLRDREYHEDTASCQREDVKAQ